MTCSSARQRQIGWRGGYGLMARRIWAGRDGGFGKRGERGEGWRVTGKRRWPWVCKELAGGGMNGGVNDGWTELQLGRMIPLTTRTACIYSNLAVARVSIHMLGNSFTRRLNVASTCCSSRFPRPSPRNRRDVPLRLQPNASVLRLIGCHAPHMRLR